MTERSQVTGYCSSVKSCELSHSTPPGGRKAGGVVEFSKFDLMVTLIFTELSSDFLNFPRISQFVTDVFPMFPKFTWIWPECLPNFLLFYDPPLLDLPEEA